MHIDNGRLLQSTIRDFTIISTRDAIVYFVQNIYTPNAVSRTTRFHIPVTNEVFFFLIRIRVFTLERIFNRAQVRLPHVRLSSARVSLPAPANCALRTPVRQATPQRSQIVVHPSVDHSMAQRIVCVYIVSDGHRANHLHDSELYIYLIFIPVVYTMSSGNRVGVFPSAVNYLPFPVVASI